MDSYASHINTEVISLERPMIFFSSISWPTQVTSYSLSALAFINLARKPGYETPSRKVVVIDQTKEELSKLIDDTRRTTGRVGLEINYEKPKHMSNQEEPDNIL
ncbi:hypothetical protein HHI36_020600 [Cryptolaemus montrouzieri]|uniref:Uncharacterized protein n=1 Tax=Cryptolaemus montrouzieri TaxID=559131 RepID=A0ABD2NB84_9CUCU